MRSRGRCSIRWCNHRGTCANRIKVKEGLDCGAEATGDEKEEATSWLIRNFVASVNLIIVLVAGEQCDVFDAGLVEPESSQADAFPTFGA
jgi:hypothetical protein